MSKIRIFFFSALIVIINASSSLSQDRIPIFLGSDNNYAPYVATTMASVLKNTKSSIDFYILSNGISQTYKEKIEGTRKFFPNNDFSIKFVEINMKQFEKFNTGWGFITQTSYTRWLIPEIGKNIKKAIWLDSDIIVVKDIAKLYNENLDGKIIGAVPDMALPYSKTDRTVEMQRYGKFNNAYMFNSGVMLIDLNKWRQNDITNKLIAQKIKILEYDKENGIETKSTDQDTCNMVVQDFKKLPYKYNTQVMGIELCINDNRCMKLHGQTEKDLINNAIIIHYIGGHKKPWNNNQEMLAEKFWEIVPFTDFADEINATRIKATRQREERQLLNEKQLLNKNKEQSNKRTKKILKRVVGYTAIIIYIIITLSASIIIINRRKTI